MSKLAEIQTILGVAADGIWGAKSQTALDLLTKAPGVSQPATTKGGPWPLEANAGQFYGESDGTATWEANHLTTFAAPYPLYMDGQPVHSIRCHKLVAEDLKAIFLEILALYGTPNEIHRVGLDQYDGCYNFRPVRGASRLSMHAYGAAIDLDAADNGLGATHGRMPADVVAIFKRHGWRWGGDYQGRKDWMHFEACR